MANFTGSSLYGAKCAELHGCVFFSISACPAACYLNPVQHWETRCLVLLFSPPHEHTAALSLWAKTELEKSREEQWCLSSAVVEGSDFTQRRNLSTEQFGSMLFEAAALAPCSHSILVAIKGHEVLHMHSQTACPAHEC
jgi:hypothetical protein